MQSVRTQSDGTVKYDFGRGILKMTSEKDYIKVNGDFATSSIYSHTDFLTAGTLEISGNFTQNNAGIKDNFHTAGDFILKFSGNRQQVIFFGSPADSSLSDVIFDNSSVQGIRISNSMYVTGNVEDNSRNVTGTIYAGVRTEFKENYFSGNITMNVSKTMTSDVTAGGTFTVSNSMNLNGFTLAAGSVSVSNGTLVTGGGSVYCKKNFTVGSYGILVMDNEMDHITVGGDFSTASVNSHLGKLTNGVLEIKGDFTQNGAAQAFACAENHSVLLSGKAGTSGRVYKQTIRFSSVGSSLFHKLTITRPLDYYSFNSDINNICHELIEDIRDSEPPSKPEGLTITEAAATTVSLTWNPSEDNIKVLGYEVYRNNEKIATVSGTEYKDIKLEPEKNYIYKVCAFDEMRNASEFSAPVSVTTTADTVAPDIPESLKVKYRTGSSIILNWRPSSDNVGCTGYKIFRNDEEIAIVQNETTYKDSGLSTGTEYIYQIKAFDGAGNESDFSSPVSGYVISPSITTISPGENTVIGSGSVTITVRFLNTGNSTGNRVKFLYSADGENWKDISRTLIGQQNFSGTELYASCSWDISKLTSGEYTVKVHFIYNETNVEPVADIEEKWYIVPSEYSVGNTIKLKIQSGTIEYGAIFESQNIVDVSDDKFPKREKCLKGFDAAFYKNGNRIDFNGTVRIELLLDEDLRAESNLKLYSLTGGNLKQIEYELTDSGLVFITDNLTDFYITVESKNNALAIGLGTSAGIVILLAGGFCILFVFLKKRKKAAATTTINLISLNEETVEQQMVQTNEPEPTLQEPIDKEFVIDGIHCFSYQSFLASLNYKDQYRQKEICSYSTEKAKRCAAGKGNGKRKELYWLGKRIAKGSSEYYDLLEKAKQIINSN